MIFKIELTIDELGRLKSRHLVLGLQVQSTLVIAHLGLRYVWESYFLAFRDEPSVYHCLRRHKKSKG